MKIHKGYLFQYAATGESWHLYVWKGKKSAQFHDRTNHIVIKDGDSFELIEPKTKDSYVVHYWTHDPEFHKKFGYKDILVKAIQKNWKINLVSWS